MLGSSTSRRGLTGLFGQHRLHSPAEVIQNYRIFADNCLPDLLPLFSPPADEWGYWVPQLSPFACWDAYNLCIHAESGEA